LNRCVYPAPTETIAPPGITQASFCVCGFQIEPSLPGMPSFFLKKGTPEPEKSAKQQALA
jgi:hypothetical protein